MSGTSINITDFKKEIPGGLEGNVYRLPTVTSMNQHGRESYWKISIKVVDADGQEQPIEDSWWNSGPMPSGFKAEIKVDSGLVNGKNRDSKPTFVAKGKNLGKANATNPFTQALRDSLALFNKQIRKVVVKPKTEIDTKSLIPPMLAQVGVLQEVTGGTADLFVQPKLDGVRCVACISMIEDEMGNQKPTTIMYSRTKIPFPGFAKIKKELTAALNSQDPPIYLDGELYKHGMKLQDISGMARREEREGDEQIDFQVYDVIVPSNLSLPFSERLKILEAFFKENSELEFVKLVPTELVPAGEGQRAAVEKLYQDYIKAGYEGAMIRIDSAYRPSHGGYHSKVLLKIKPTFDAEYKVTGFTCGSKGKAANALMFICQTPEGHVFNVTPAMTIEEREALYKKMQETESNGKTHFQNNYEGRPLIVYYDELSNLKVPQRARTKGEIRTWD